MKQIKIRVCGRVQGVGFRYFTYQQAQKLALTGYVKNLDNGDVEIVAQGDNSQIDQLITWLNQGGPASAKISRFTTHSCFTDKELFDLEALTSFNVRY